MAENEIIELAKKQVAALNAHDLESYVSRIDGSYVGHTETSPEPIRGPEGVRANTGMLLTAFPDLKVEVQDILASGDTVVTRVHVTGTHKAAFAGIPATNNRISIDGCTVVEFKNGKAVRARTYSDTLTLMQQLGVVSLPRAASA